MRLLAAIFAGLIGVATLGAPGASAQVATNGIAETYAVGGFNTNFSASVVVVVPYVVSNADWYTNWLMFVAAIPDSKEQPMVQAGVMRWLDHGQKLTAFVAYSMRGKDELVYHDLGAITAGEHTVRISGDKTTLYLAIDDKRVATYARKDFFISSDHTYFQYGSEVNRTGDRPAGYLRDPRVKEDTDMTEHSIGASPCIHDDRGLVLMQERDVFTPSGTFTAGGPSGFRGDCKRP